MSALCVISHSKPTTGELEVEAATRVLMSGNLAQDAEVAAFEAEVAALAGKRHAIAMSSGTGALHLAVVSLGIGSGDEVVVPSYVCTALLHAIRAAGAHPVVCDIDPHSRNIDVARAKECLSPQSKAIVAPHMFGLTLDVSELAALGLPVIEDCAMALGGECRGAPAGGVGDLAICSFYATKVISSGGEGGMVLTDDESVATLLRGLREYDGLPAVAVRHNYKMTELAAAIGRVQLRRLPLFIAHRRRLAARYSRAFEGAVGIPPAPTGHIYYRYVIHVDGEDAADALMAALEEDRIHARRPVHSPLHRELGLDDSGYPQATRAHAGDVSLPIYPGLDDCGVDRVIDGVRRALEHLGGLGP